MWNVEISSGIRQFGQLWTTRSRPPIRRLEKKISLREHQYPRDKFCISENNEICYFETFKKYKWSDVVSTWFRWRRWYSHDDINNDNGARKCFRWFHHRNSRMAKLYSIQTRLPSLQLLRPTYSIGYSRPMAATCILLEDIMNLLESS